MKIKNQIVNFLKAHKFALILFVICSLYACNEIFEEDLSSKNVKLGSPSNNVTTVSQSLQFWWGAVDGASAYNIQIVSPSFDSSASLVVNQNIEKDTFNITLKPGRYQWRVQALNSISSSAYETFSFTILSDTSQDLRLQEILLDSPTNNFYSNQKNNTFSWGKLIAANEYRIQIASSDFSSTANIKVDKRITANSFVAELEEGVYRWRVRGENDKSNTDYTERVLTVDLSAPAAPTLTGPPNDTLASVPVLLRWDADVNNSVRDTLYVYLDSTATNLVLKKPLTDTFYNFKDTTSSVQYYWRARSVDKANNSSLYSNWRWFKVKK